MRNIKSIISIFLLSFIFFSCENSTKNRNENSTKYTELLSNKYQAQNEPDFENNAIENPNGKFKILKVDSISNEYMIYAFKAKKYYKILSNKNDLINKNCKRISLNKTYDLILKIEYSQRGIYENVSGIARKDGPVIYFEGDSITDLYTSPNIQGLYYNPRIEKN